MDVWGIGPGFDDTATTFSVCTWLNIFYVVGIKTHLQITTLLLFDDDDYEYLFRGSQTLFGLTACPAMEKLPSAAPSVRIFGFLSFGIFLPDMNFSFFFRDDGRVNFRVLSERILLAAKGKHSAGLFVLILLI